jgi:hypothetical protein
MWKTEKLDFQFEFRVRTCMSSRFRPVRQRSLSGMWYAVVAMVFGFDVVIHCITVLELRNIMMQSPSQNLSFPSQRFSFVFVYFLFYFNIIRYLKNYYLFVSREQASYRRNLDEDLISELEESRLKRLNQVTEHKNNISESTEEAAEASSNLIRAKQNYIKVLAEVEVVRQKLSVAVTNLHALKNMTDAERKKKKEEEKGYSMGRLFSAFERTPEEECKHQSKKLKKLESEMVLKRQEIEEKKIILLEKIQRKESFYTQVMCNSSFLHPHHSLHSLSALLSSSFLTVCVDTGCRCLREGRKRPFNPHRESSSPVLHHREAGSGGSHAPAHLLRGGSRLPAELRGRHGAVCHQESGRGEHADVFQCAEDDGVGLQDQVDLLSSPVFSCPVLSCPVTYFFIRFLACLLAYSLTNCLTFCLLLLPPLAHMCSSQGRDWRQAPPRAGRHHQPRPHGWLCFVPQLSSQRLRVGGCGGGPTRDADRDEVAPPRPGVRGTE